MVMMDLQKAFDTVDHSILENKLKAIGLDGNAIAWFDAYLTNRMQVTDVGGIFSDPRVVPCGVPQGSMLGPLFFCYTLMIWKHLSPANEYSMLTTLPC